MLIVEVDCPMGPPREFVPVLYAHPALGRRMDAWPPTWRWKGGNQSRRPIFLSRQLWISIINGGYATRDQSFVPQQGGKASDGTYFSMEETRWSALDDPLKRHRAGQGHWLGQPRSSGW
jgi:hypothetical protein